MAVPWTLNGTALAITRDGGRTWNEARIAAPHPASAPPPPAPANPWRAYWTAVDPGSGIQFVSPQAGFALAGEPLNLLDRGLSAPIGPMVAWPSPAVLVSRDRGQSWQPSLPASTGFWGLAFADHAHGIAVGVTSLYRTDDGGGDWRQITEPDPSLVRVAYLQAPQTVAGLTTMGQLMASRDGGSSWHHAAWGLEGRAICSVGDAVLVADQGGGVWRSKDLGFPFNEAASRIATPLEDSPWWIDLSCAGHNAVEYMQAFPEAAGAGVQTIVRQSTDGGYRWRRIAQIAWGAARPGAPSPVQAVAVGRRKVCILSYANKPTLDIRCTSDGGRTFRQARTPPMPRSQYADLHLQGVTFLGPSHGWLLVVDSLVNGRQPPRYETQIWATADGGASWRVAYASPIARVPQLR